MAKQNQQIRGNTATMDAFTGAAGVFTIDSERQEIRIHDGVTPGGHRVPSLETLILTFIRKDSEFGNVDFAESARGILTRIADKTYVLRNLAVEEPLEITNANGVDGDPTIGINADQLDDLLIGGVAGRIAYAGVTTGTVTAFEAEVPSGWPNTAGSLAWIRFDQLPAEAGATLQLRDDLDPLPLHTTAGGIDLSNVFAAGELCLVTRIGDAYIVSNLRTAAGIPIKAIAGFAPTNIQTAIEALVAATAGDEGGAGLNGYQTFGAMSAITGPITPTKLNLDDGEGRVVIVQYQEIGKVDFNTGGYGPQYNGPVLSSVVTITDTYMILRNGANYYQGLINTTSLAPQIVPDLRAFTGGDAAAPVPHSQQHLYRVPVGLKFLGPNPSLGAATWRVYISDKRDVI